SRARSHHGPTQPGTACRGRAARTCDDPFAAHHSAVVGFRRRCPRSGGRHRSRALVRAHRTPGARPREAKQQLSKSEERFRALTENALDITAIVSPQGRIDYASPSIEPVMGYAPGGLLGANVLDLVHPEDVTEVQ